ncbi:SufD family Fe-S cluster assembly protein [Candidatus Gottesmanbacteria bacterium]|nr:SufD family Fe-S cluster assembly protein [Candidatus Gottesmanbacteria bacterium]
MKTNTIIIDSLKNDQQFSVGDNEEKTFVIFLTDNISQNGKVKIIIEGKKANVQILGIIIGQGQQKIDLYTLQDHLKPESVSDLYIKSVLFDEARFNYQGLIKIEKDAQKSNAYQKNQNLLLSKKAWADSRPYLEILANDVRCTHGATVGKIDDEQLYYLQSRGLGIVAAKKLIIEGYCQDVINRIDDDKIREELKVKIDEKIKILLSRMLN